MAKASIENIMSDEIIYIHEDALVGQAAHILLRFRINGILIMEKGSKDRVVGVFTTTDLLAFLDKALSHSGRRKAELKRIAAMPVSTVMKRNVIKIQVNDRIEKLLAVIHRKGVHTIPVYDGDKLVGVIGRHDLLNAAFNF